MTLYLSRLALNKDASARALIPLLNPSEPGQAADAHHRLIWLVFSDGSSRTRDFLWRYEGNGRFMTLSARKPQVHDLFQEPETKEFNPKLQSGDRLHYVLRVNATKMRRVVVDPREHKRKSKREDVVMNLLYKEPPSAGGRAGARNRVAAEAATAWIESQAAKKGFQQCSTVTEGYSTLKLGHRRGEGATFGILDLSGKIKIKDPVVFLSALAQGFGRAKAWGCGLMLIRRAR